MSNVNWAALAKEEGFYQEPKIKKVVQPRRGQRKRTPDVVTMSPDRLKMWCNKVEYRQIPQYPHYYISREGDVRNLDGYLLRNKITSSNSKISLRVGVKDVKIYRYILVWQAWPEIAPTSSTSSDGSEQTIFWDGLEWKTVAGFPGYIITRSGRVIRTKNWTELTINKGRAGMSREGKQIYRSVRRLVMETFGSELE